MGSGDSVMQGLGASPGRMYFRRLVTNSPDELANMQGFCLSRVDAVVNWWSSYGSLFPVFGVEGQGEEDEWSRDIGSGGAAKPNRSPRAAQDPTAKRITPVTLEDGLERGQETQTTHERLHPVLPKVLKRLA